VPYLSLWEKSGDKKQGQPEHRQDLLTEGQFSRGFYMIFDF
jgi:hypothetical protein